MKLIPSFDESSTKFASHAIKLAFISVTQELPEVMISGELVPSAILCLIKISIPFLRTGEDIVCFSCYNGQV